MMEAKRYQVEEGERVLDLGCGYAKVWRNNWEDIPKNVHIDAYDVRGSWADDFEKYVDPFTGEPVKANKYRRALIGREQTTG